MPDLQARLIEAAVRPLDDDAEMKLAASHLLAELVKTDPEGAEEAIACWDTVDAHKRKPLWRVLLFSVLVIVSAVIWTDGVKAVVNRRKMFGNSITDIFYSDPGPSSVKVARRLTEKQRLLLYADSTEGLKSEKTKALWDSDPTNPAYFAEYAAYYFSEHGSNLPPDFLETARRIDPQNAWFTYVAAGVKAKDAVKKKKQTKAEIAANKTPEWDILDPTKMADALAILRQARDQPQCESYQPEVLRQQLQLLSGRTPAEVMRQLLFVLGSPSGAEINIRPLAEVIHQPPLTDGDLKPGRLLDHEILSRFFSYASWVLMAVCLGSVAAYRFRVSRMVRRLAGRMEKLLNAKDWGWVMGAGVLLPFAFVMAVNRLTPLGGRQFGVAGNSMMLPAAQFLGLLMLWLVVPAQVVRWRLAKRAGVFGFPKSSRVGWLAVACAAAFVPVIGWAVVSSSFDVFRGISMREMTLEHFSLWTPHLAFRIALGSLGMSVLWVIFQSSAAIFSRANRLISRATSSMVLLRVYAAVMLLLALASIGFKVSEQHWFDRDTLSKVDASEPGWSHFEYQVAVQMRKELRELLGY